MVSGVVIAIRLAWTMIPRPTFGESWRERLVVGWSGMRGAISLAAALSVPTSLPERPEILLLTFGVIFVTLLGQGLTLPVLLHKLDLPTANRWSPDEAMARLEAAQAALDRLDELEQQGADPEGCGGSASSTAGASRRAWRCSAAASSPTRGARGCATTTCSGATSSPRSAQRC